MEAKSGMSFVPFAPWEPDKALLGGKHAPQARGVLPSASGYVPFPSLWQDPLPLLPGACRGALSLYDSEGEPLILAGTDDGLYTLHQKQWQNIGSDYSGNGHRWDFARYGNTIVAVNGVDVPQYATLGPGTISDFAAIDGAPVGSSVEVIKEFIMLGGVEKTKVRWSALGNPLDWPEPGSNDAQYKQSDEQDFPDTGSAVAVSGALSGLDVAIFTERAVYRGAFIGPPYFFRFDILDKGKGCIAPKSAVTGSNAIYFLSEEGFFATDGGSIINIGLERITNWFRAASDDTRRHETRGAIDPVTGIVFWTFAGKGAVDGVHSHVLAFHPQLNQWSYGHADTTEIFVDLSRGYTLEDLDAIGPLDSLGVSLDSRVWQGGVPVLSAFSPENGLCHFSGPAMEATIETAETGGERMLVHGIRPLVDGAKASASLLYRDFQHQPSREAQCSSLSAFNGVAYTHVSTRYGRARIVIPAGGSWSHAVGCDILTEKEGAI
jgi:hypothetical protein